MAIKFLKKGIKVNGQYMPVHYSKGPYTDASGLLPDTITVYGKKYKPLPRELNPKNESDIQTDYFENDRARIPPNSKFHKEIMKATRGKF